MTSGYREEFTRGWRTLCSATVGNAAGTSGVAYYTFGVFIVPLVEAFGWTRGQVSIAASFLIFGTAVTAPFVGAIIDKYGARRISIASLSFLGIGYLGLAQIAGSISVFYAAWLLVAVIGGGTSPVVWTRAISVWFNRARGFALGITLAGTGVVGIFGPLFCAVLINAYGWKGGYIGLAGLILFVACPVLILLFRDHTNGSEHSRSNDASAATVTPSVPNSFSGLTLQESLRVPSFWIIAAGFFLVSAVVAGVVINIIPVLMDRGLSTIEAASTAGALGVSVVVGRIGIGFLIDRISAPLVARFVFGMTAVACVLLAIEGTPYWIVTFCVMALGLTAAAEVDLLAYLIGRYFGMKSYGKIYGWQIAIFYVGAAAGPFLVGSAFDYYNGYVEVLFTCAVALLVSAAVVGSLSRFKKFTA